MDRDNKKCYFSLFNAYVFTLLVFVVFMTTSHKINAELYTGKIGDKETILEIVDNDDKSNIEYNGRYFDIDKPFDQLLSGLDENAELLLFEDTEPNFQLPYFRLIYQDTGLLGLRINNSVQPNQKQPVILHKIHSIVPSPDDSPYLEHLSLSDPYEYLRQKSFTFKEITSDFINLHKLDKQHLINTFNLVDSTFLNWYQELSSGLEFFNIRGDDRSTLNVNHSLEAIYRPFLTDLSQCNDDNPFIAIRPTLLETNYLSVAIESHLDCHGAHPIDDFKGKIIERTTGNQILLSNYLELPSPKDLNKWIINQLKSHYPDKIKNSECNYGLPDYWTNTNEDGWLLTDKGIMLIPQGFPEYLRSCKFIDWAVIPYTAINA